MDKKKKRPPPSQPRLNLSPLLIPLCFFTGGIVSSNNPRDIDWSKIDSLRQLGL